MADRIVVMSARPGRVRAIHTMDFPDAYGGVLPPLKRRNDPAFGHVFNQIWKELDMNDQT